MAEDFDRLKAMKDNIAAHELSVDAEALARIEKELDAANVPKEVWIGTDSVADRVTWLITRNALNQQNSRSRFTTMNLLADLVEAALGSAVMDLNWRDKAEDALIRAGRKKGNHDQIKR